MVLVDLDSGTEFQIEGFVYQHRDFEGKLRQLGLMPGDKARLIRKAPLDGPVLLEIQGREIALGKGIASGILVRVVA